MVKKTLKRLLRYLGIKAPWIVRLFLLLAIPVPRLFIAIAQWSGQSQPVMTRTWNIHSGPLKGYRLFNLLLPEIVPVLANSMEISCSKLLPKLNLDATIVFDVGGSYGYYALLLARLVGRGRVYSFEPDWHSYGRLVQNLSINAIQNVIPVPVCISNSQPTLLKWNSREDDPWNSSPADNQLDTQTLTVAPVMSLDEFSRVLNFQDQIGFIKIDVEGAEYDVLKSAARLLDSAHPLILCELHGAEIAQQVFEFLSIKHYEWEMVEYMSETRQHILAFPSGQSVRCRALIEK